MSPELRERISPTSQVTQQIPDQVIHVVFRFNSFAQEICGVLTSIKTTDVKTKVNVGMMIFDAHALICQFWSICRSEEISVIVMLDEQQHHIRRFIKSIKIQTIDVIRGTCNVIVCMN